jgi:hypothetical protein
VARGDVSEYKYKMELAETGYKSLIVKINAIQAEMNAYQSIYRHLSAT